MMKAGGTLRRLRVALLCATFLYPATEARAEPISTAIGLSALIAGGLGVSATVAGVIGGAIISGAVSVGASMLSNALRSSPDGGGGTSTPIGTQASLTAGAVTARQRVYGKMAVAGTLVYWRVYGVNNSFMQMVIVLGSGPHDLFDVIDDGKTGNLEATGDPRLFLLTSRKSDEGAAYGTVKFYNGFEDQEVCPDLVANADPAQPWTTDYRGRGVCYAVVQFQYSEDVFPGGIPTLQFVIGARLYDRRKDSTNGGIGPHRWNDPHTWEFSDNVAVALYEYERGLVIGSQQIVGRQLAPADMIDAYFVTAANICDEAVALKAGGTEPRYRVGMNVGADRDLSSVERDFATAMAGQVIETIGAFGPYAGAAQATAMTFTDADLVEGREARYSQKRSRSELVNAVYGAFTDPAQNYQPIPYAPRFSSADEASDGGRYVVQRDVIMIPSETQAQRVVEAARREGRLQETATVTLSHKYSPLEAGDWVRWISARRDFNFVFKVIRHELHDDRTITLTLRRIDASVFAWDEQTDQGDPQNPASLPGYGQLINSVPGFDVTALQILGSGVLQIPAIKATWSPILDATVDAVTVQYRVGTDDATIKIAPPFSPADGEGIISDGIQPDTAYQARALITTTPARAVTWTDWKPVTAPTNHIVKFAASVAPGSTGYAQLTDYVRRRFAAGDAATERVTRFLASIQVQAKFADYERRLRARIDLDNADRRIGTRITQVSEIIDEVDLQLAAFQIFVAAELAGVQSTASLALTAATDAATAQAAFELAATTQLGALSSEVSAVGSSVTDLETTVSDFTTAVNATVGGLSVSVTATQTAVATVNAKLVGIWGVTIDVNGHASGLKLVSDGTVSAFTVGVDYFRIASPSISGGAGKVVFQVGTRDGVADVVMKGQFVVDGAIITKSIFGDGATFTRITPATTPTVSYNNSGTHTFLISQALQTKIGATVIECKVSNLSSPRDFFGETITYRLYVNGALRREFVSQTLSGTNLSPPSGESFFTYDLGVGSQDIAIWCDVNGTGAAGNPTRSFQVLAELFVIEPRDSRIGI